MTLRFYDGGSFKILAAKPLVHWFFLLACLVFRALLLLPFAVDMDSYLVLAATNLPSTPMKTSTWVPTGPTQNVCMPSLSANDCDNNATADTTRPRSTNYTTVSDDTVNSICNETGRTRYTDDSYRMGFCSWRTLASLGESPQNDCLNKSTEECIECLRKHVRKEEEIRAMHEEYASIIHRFDCDRNYSMWRCQECKDSYKDWLCATQLPYYHEGTRVRPCLDHCTRTKRKCPYLLPHKQYCGQRSFLCPEKRDLDTESTYSRSPCMNCKLDEHGLCVAANVYSTASPGGGTIHSIPHLQVLLLGCVISLILARTLSGQCIT